MEFGRYAAENARKQGKKPATFNFLGFAHIGARSRQGKFTGHGKTIAKRLGRGLKAIGQWCKTAPSRSCERAAENPERQASRPLPVPTDDPRTTGQFGSSIESPAPLERMAEPTDSGTAADLGTVRRNTTSAPAPAASDHTHLAEHRESRLKNPLRETCTLGSVRGEN